VAKRAVFSAYCASSTWQESVGKFFAHDKSTGGKSPPLATAVRMTRRVESLECSEMNIYGCGFHYLRQEVLDGYFVVGLGV
jgi:hypothetical protein